MNMLCETWNLVYILFWWLAKINVRTDIKYFLKYYMCQTFLSTVNIIKCFYYYYYYNRMVFADSITQ